jgi:UDP:flavonoid glycosyltransferase YjiC (YdhE family)
VNILLCPLSDPGYLYPAIAVGRELKRRGNAVSVLGRSSAAAVTAQAGLPLLPAADYGGHSSFSVRRWIIEGLGQYRATHRAAREISADVLVTSVLCNGALLAAQTLDIPVVVLGFAAHLWEYQLGGESEPVRPVTREWQTRIMAHYIAVCCEQAGFPERSTRPGCWPPTGTALLLRGDPALEYPGTLLPDRVSHIGPCDWEPLADDAELEAVREHLDRVGKPVVYVHLGRVFGGRNPWPRLNAAFTGGPFQAVVEQGRSGDPQPAPEADLLVVRKPWMGPLIDRAGLVLTSGTSAPVLSALLRGRPLGVSPAGSEQPLLAEACVRAGVAVYVPDQAGPDPSAVLRAAWDDRELHARAQELGASLSAADGSRRAADVIHQVVTGRPAHGLVGIRP